MKKNIPTFINYLYKYVYYVCPLNISIKTIINKNGNKIFRKKNFLSFINYFHKVCLSSISIKTNINGLFERECCTLYLCLKLAVYRHFTII